MVLGAWVSDLTVQTCIVLRTKYITVLGVGVRFFFFFFLAGLDLDLDLPLATLDLKLKPKLELELARFPVAYLSTWPTRSASALCRRPCRLLVAPTEK